MTFPLNRYVLARTDEGIGAVMITEEIKTPKEAVKYKWCYLPGGYGSFTDETVTHGEGMAVVGDSGVVGSSFLHCGPIRLSWSSPRYVYFPWCGEDLALCATQAERMTDLNLSDPNLFWHRGEPDRRLEKKPIGRAFWEAWLRAHDLRALAGDWGEDR